MASCLSLQMRHQKSLDRPISESPGNLFPQFSLNLAEKPVKKHIRSFGDLLVLGRSEEEVTHDATTVITTGSTLDNKLLAEWEDRNEQGLFRYDVTACPTKVVIGAYGFLAQLNEGRGTKKRPTEFRTDQVLQDFDSNKFNFTKIPQKEILFHLDETSSNASFDDLVILSDSPNLVLINVSPIEYGHVLLVPKVLDCIPQMVDSRSLLLALHFCHQAQNPYFRLCFNSLGAYGTVNHLHFQAYYLAAPFPVERAITVPVEAEYQIHPSVEIAILNEYPVRGIVFEAWGPLSKMAFVVGEICEKLQKADIPHNLLVVDCGQRCFLFPNNFSRAKAKGLVPDDLLDTQVDPASFEIAGHLILKRKEDYERVTQDWLWKLLSFASYSEEEFQNILKLVLGIRS